METLLHTTFAMPPKGWSGQGRGGEAGPLHPRAARRRITPMRALRENMIWKREMTWNP
ncbi:MAG TPA: hypothetical protein VHG33_07905 [Woeseiaceae bacterium]|nr:hypothetical protein [Woeseiaceae bacterium]